MSRKWIIAATLLLVGCSSVHPPMPAPVTVVSDPPASATEEQPAQSNPPATTVAPSRENPQEAWVSIHPDIQNRGSVTAAMFSFADHERIMQAVGEGSYQRFSEPALIEMPDSNSYTGTVSAVDTDQLVLDARERPFTVTYRLEGTFDSARYETELFGVLGSGQITVQPDGDYYIQTDTMSMMRRSGQVWLGTAGGWAGPFRADDVAHDLPKSAVAQLTPDQLGFLDVAYWSNRGLRKVLPDGTEEWYNGGMKLTTISVLGSGWYSCYYYKLTVKKQGDRYRPITVDVHFWDAANLGLHAEWNFDTPVALPKPGS